MERIKQGPVGPIFFIPVYFDGNEAGDQVCPAELLHSHEFDHAVLCLKGRIRVSVVFEGEDVRVVAELEAGQAVNAERGKEHKLEKMEPGSVAYCVAVADQVEEPFATVRAPE